jgi:cysteinyl-tRNA synthetase
MRLCCRQKRLTEHWKHIHTVIVEDSFTSRNVFQTTQIKHPDSKLPPNHLRTHLLNPHTTSHIQADAHALAELKSARSRGNTTTKAKQKQRDESPAAGPPQL